jgi:hypothetical protein
VGIGTSVFLFVLGAILAFAVHVPVDGVNINTLGVILMVVGLLGGVLSLLFWNSWGGWGEPGGRVYRRERRVVDPGYRSVPVVQSVPAVQAVPQVPVVASPPVVGTPVAGAAPVVAPVASPGYVDGAGMPIAGQAVPVVPAVGGAVPVARPAQVRRTTTYYEDRL